eukprot:TRINITY_DN768_c0_g1_i2.p1 TRINITY_DN768_c0_g1~~TRINITY_DN768_c0_g1_i2.p1  ORF type:complete len:191 (+),score=51.04 TRINITY_DN768_c0_g1_i2:533-1105(+)
MIKETGNVRLRILDVGSGSGCIALYMANYLPQCSVLGIDINPEAVMLAEENKKIHNIANAGFKVCDVFAGDVGEGSFDLIVSNPPYIPKENYKRLPRSVKKWEDKGALVGDELGTNYHFKLLQLSQSILSKNSLPLPKIVFEIDGKHQIDPITSFSQQYGYFPISHKDTNNKFRYMSFWTTNPTHTTIPH